LNGREPVGVALSGQGRSELGTFDFGFFYTWSAIYRKHRKKRYFYPFIDKMKLGGNFQFEGWMM